MTPLLRLRDLSSGCGAVLVLAALAARMALPAAHGLELRRTDPGASWALAAFAVPAAWSDADPRGPGHDPATCPICQSLLRGGHASPSATASAELPAATRAVPAPRPACEAVATARSSHPPRAPPSHLPV